MGSGFSPLIFLLYSVFVLQCLLTTEGHRKNFEEYVPGMKHDGDWNNHLRLRPSDDGNSGNTLHDHSSLSQMDPELNVFFHHNELKVGNKMLIYFATKDPSTTPHLLSRQESDVIPFSSSQLPYILELFSFPEGSKQAKAMKITLEHCEFPPMKGESKFCATSLESMLDSVRQISGSNSKLRVLTTNYLSESISLLQNYTISEPPTEIFAKKIVGCHTLPYPYAVFYCHGQVSDNKLYKVLLAGEDGGRVEAAAMCHMDTSHWDPNHVSFRVLKTVPGASPVCHFFPTDNLVWILS
ncbi:UNVERIFIED_CONTAM: BURP domain-containing protein BNM2A [Sesamum latifolium]|uniref:BURP domain-containing protein BNM2A n=1 Tax=Sesamum latifolium TaxID=2727402 RepID=A0AAW2XQU3_9LAMI